MYTIHRLFSHFETTVTNGMKSLKNWNAIYMKELFTFHIFNFSTRLALTLEVRECLNIISVPLDIIYRYYLYSHFQVKIEAQRG